MKQKLLNHMSSRVNELLFLDQDNIALLGQLEGSCYLARFTDLSLSLYFLFSESGLIILANPPQQVPDACLYGSTTNLIGAGINNSTERIKIEGDLIKASQLQKLLKQINLPFGQLISNKFGNEVGYAFETFGSGVKRFLGSASESVKDSAYSYIKDELELCVSEFEFQELKGKIVSLRNRLEKLEKKYADG